MMFLNIITPCSRPKNLYAISESINIPYLSYRWIVVFDNNELPDNSIIPKNCEYYLHKDQSSIFGNAQRNYALSLITNGHIYFNDDDTTIHPLLWENIENLEHHDFISFKQKKKNGSHRLNSNKIKVKHIDSHNFIISTELLNNNRFINKYNADGVFAVKCFSECKNPIHLDKYLSIYNSLR